MTTGVRRKARIALLAVAMVGALSYSLVMAMGATSAYYVTVAEARARPDALGDRTLRIQGVVIGSSVRWDASTMRLGLVIADSANPAETMAVSYRGARPDGLQDGRTIIAEGRISPGASEVEAHTLMVQCPSRYEAEEPTRQGTRP